MGVFWMEKPIIYLLFRPNTLMVYHWKSHSTIIQKKVVFLPRCFVIQRRQVKSPASMFLVIDFNTAPMIGTTDFPYSATGYHGSFFLLWFDLFSFPRQNPPLFPVPAARAAGWRTRIFPFFFKKGCTKCGVVVSKYEKLNWKSTTPAYGHPFYIEGEFFFGRKQRKWTNFLYLCNFPS